jgi:hypothetical protein
MSGNLQVMLLRSAQMLVGWVWRHQNTWECEMVKIFPKYTGHFIKFSMITNIYSKKTKGPTLMEFFTATGKLKKIFFDN